MGTLRFGSAKLALKHLANLTGRKVVVAATSCTKKSEAISYINDTLDFFQLDIPEEYHDLTRELVGKLSEVRKFIETSFVNRY